MWCVMFFDSRVLRYTRVIGSCHLSCWQARKLRVSLNRKFPELSFISVKL